MLSVFHPLPTVSSLYVVCKCIRCPSIGKYTFLSKTTFREGSVANALKDFVPTEGGAKQLLIFPIETKGVTHVL